MSRLACIVLLLGCGLGKAPAFAQEAQDNSRSVTCEFNDGKQMVVRYNLPSGRSDTPQAGKPWLPGGAAMTLFTETTLALGPGQILPGGYTLYLIPAKKNWAVAVSRNTKVDAPYDAAQDVAKANMDTGTLSNKEDSLNISLGHMGPQQCELMVDYGTQRYWAEFYQR
jgi:hypothetical protein